MQVYTLPGQKEIEKVAERFRTDSQQVTTTDLAINSAKQLTQLILAPVADKLPGKRLVIVADGGLQTIPFGALADITSNKYQPLMINHEIVNLPSASTIAIQRQKLANRQSAPKAIAILADPVYSATDTRVTGKPENTQLAPEIQFERSALNRSARSLKRNGLPRLANTATEAKGILKLIPAATSLEALSFDANYDWATSKTLNQFRILHFATHGFVNQEQPELSGIVLSLVDKKGKPIRGYLRLGDLFNQDYPAELIVLSACETGLANQPDKADDQEFKRAVIGWDDRVPMLSRQYPWSAIGRVQGLTTKGEDYHCTGTLISEDVVLTNSHCVIDPETHQASQKILFLPNLINGKVADESDIAQVQNVIYGTDFTKTKLENQTDDWALLKLDKPIGLKYGYLGWKSLPSSTLTKNRNKYIFVGYSGDFPNTNKEKYRFFTAGKGWTASVQVGCSIVGEEGNVLLHDCDTTGGSSGGAIIGVIGNQPYIIGLNNAEIKTRDGRGIINLGVKIDFLDRLVGK
ncbi:hypothetical protein DP116_27580 [Brasilonema bromeliae SPC951]|uniref:Peptidase S1 domain-containing protein n=2 Tax=Bromeliae group (in: Brasilonema) TaxID=3398495 RepID=A0ABX1PFA4_9CYAN|nr:hypothetical protein [Brasilonema bromeliae SPC951]